MIRRVAVQDLVGAHEIAERLGVARPQVVHDWRRRHADFPQPIAQLKTALIWDWTAVRKWAEATGRTNSLAVRRLRSTERQRPTN